MGKCEQKLLSPEDFEYRPCGAETDRTDGGKYQCEACAKRVTEYRAGIMQPRTMPLKIEYNEAEDVLTINGDRYSGDVFRCGVWPWKEGDVVRVVRKDGTVHVTRLQEAPDDALTPDDEWQKDLSGFLCGEPYKTVCKAVEARIAKAARTGR